MPIDVYKSDRLKLRGSSKMCYKPNECVCKKHSKFPFADVCTINDCCQNNLPATDHLFPRRYIKLPPSLQKDVNLVRLDKLLRP